MPNEKDVWFLQSENGAVELDSLNNIPESSGFVLYPFSLDSSSKPYFIEADRHSKLSLEDIYNNTLVDNWGWKVEDLIRKTTVSKTKEYYSKSVQDAVDEIRSGHMQKVVLSRILPIDTVVTKNPLAIFYELCIKYTTAFISLVCIPNEVLWITATPELLISCNDSKIKTVSLAGTKPIRDIDGWDDKEKEEQQVVTEYINKILEEYCGNITVYGPEEVIAGNVKHLKTSFSATLNTELWSLVSALHPTPAVCGIPLVKAKQFIKLTEGYDRKYYTGFLGPCNVEGKTDLFVNLRCAEMFRNGVNLYVGGGITKDSKPEKEWEETELKLKTLLFAFEEKKYEKK